MNHNINWSKTKKKVELIIKKYVYFCLSVDNKSTSEISNEFVLEMLKLGNQDLNNVYIPMSEEERVERTEFINYFRISFNRLTTEERKIIYWTYLDKEHSYDDTYIANNLGFSLGYYYIRKKETLIRFAYALGAEISIE